jgi:LmbE family N-acetylglucosaminyl deacetylase
MRLDIAPPIFPASRRIAVVSPHLDDAALSCGALIAGCPDVTVITLFAGVPADGSQSTAWDRACGFYTAEEAMAARREEDRAAMTSLGAAVRQLDRLDGQYQPPTSAGDDARNAAALFTSLMEVAPEIVVVPLGLFHSDHLRARRAWMHCARREEWSSVQWVAYEDVPYRCIGTALQTALADLHGTGFGATPALWDSVIGNDTDAANVGGSRERTMPTTSPFDCKQSALHAYGSQLLALGAAALADAFKPERFWAISPNGAT